MGFYLDNIIEIKEKARQVLQGNIFSSETYFYTCPGLGHYEYQWLWDSCFHAIICQWVSGDCTRNCPENDRDGKYFGLPRTI